MTRWLVVVVVALLAGSGCKKLTAWTADAHSGKVNVWLFAPRTVAPGDKLPATVETASGYRSGISTVQVYVGDKQDTVTGAGVTWGYSVGSRESSEDDLDLEIRIPPDAPSGPLKVSLVVEYVSAESAGNRTFENVEGADQVDFVLQVGTPGARTMSRLWLIARGLASLVALAGLVYFVTYRHMRRKPAPDGGGGGGDADFLAYLMIFALIGIGYLGYWLFALPTVRGVMSASSLLRYALIALWFVVPVVAIIRGFRRGRAARQIVRGFEGRLRAVVGRPGSPYRKATTGEPLDQRAAPAVPLAQLRATLEREGLAVKPRRNALQVDAKAGAVRITASFPERVTPELLVLAGPSRDAVLDVARRLVPDLGPIVLEINADAGTRELLDGGAG